MSDQDLSTTIKVNVDGSGVESGLTSVKRSIQDLGASVKTITDQTNAKLAEIGKGDLKLDASVAKATKAVIKETGELERQLATFGSTAFSGFTNIGKSAEAAYVAMAGKSVPTTYIDTYVENLKKAQGLSAKMAQEAAQAAAAQSAITQRAMAEDAHYADLKRQHAAYSKTLADQEIASTKARAAALAAYYAEAQNAELNLIHTGRGKSSAYLIDKGQRLGFTEAEINTAVAGNKKIEASLAAAFAAANPHLEKMRAQAEASNTSVKGLSASLRNVPAQFTDIVVSLQGGQAPLTVLLQQGGQLRDMFGGAGQAARALGGYILGLVNPYTIAAAAVAGLGVAMASINGKDAALLALSTQLSGTGRASVAAIGDIKSLVNELNTVPGVSKSAATAILGEFAKVSGLGGEMFRSLGGSVADFATATGTDLPTAAKKLAGAFADPAKGVKELEESLGTLTSTQILTIEKMAAMGDKAGAQAALFDALKASTQGLADQAMTPLGQSTERMSNAWDAMTTSVGNADGFRAANRMLAATIDNVAALTAKLSSLRLPEWLEKKFYGGLNGMVYDAITGGPQYGATGEWNTGGASGSFAPTASETDKQVKAALDATKSYASQSEAMARLKDTAKQTKDALAELATQNKSDSVEAQTLRDRLVGVNEKLAEMAKKAKGPAYQVPEYDKLISSMNEANTAAQREIATGEALSKSEKFRITTLYNMVDAYNAKKISAKQLADAEAYLDKVTGEMAGAEQAIATSKAEEEAIKAIGKARADAIKSHAKELESLGEKAQKIEDEVAMYGMSKEAIESLTTARMIDQAAMLKQFDPVASANVVAQIEQVIAARQRLAAAGTALDQKDAAAKAAEKSIKDLEAENKRAAEASEKYWEDALMRAFESGKGFFESLWDTIKNTLKTQVLKVTIQGVMGSVGLGAAGAASAAGVSSTGLLGSLSNASSLANLASGGYSSLLGSGVGALFGQTAGNAAIATALTGSASSAAAAASAAATAGGAAASAATSAAGIGSTIATALPWLAGGLAIASLFGGSKKVSSTSTGGTQASFDASGARTAYNPYYDTEAGTTAGADAMVQSLQDSYMTTAKTLGIAAAQTTFTYGGNTGKNGADPQFYIGGGAGDSSYMSGQTQVSDAAVSLAASRAVFAALQGSELPKYLTGVFDGITASTATQDQITSTLQGAQALAAFHADLEALPFAKLADLSYAATQKLIGFSGGLESLQTNLAGYYTNFYSAEEQRAQLVKNINATVGGGFDAGSTSASAFRAAVESAMADTSDAGLQLTANLLKVQGSMAQLVNGSETAASAVSAAAQKLAAENQGWADKLALLTGAETDRSIALRDATDETTRTLMRQVYAQEDLQEAAQATTSALSGWVSRLAADVTSAEQNLQSAKDDVRRAYDAELAGITNSYNTAKDAATKTKTIFDGIADQFGDFASSLAGAVEAPAQSFERLKAEYTRLSDLARLGDADAATQAVSVGNDLKASIIAKSGTSLEAQREIAKLANSATATASIATTQADIAKGTLASLEASYQINKSALEAQVSGFISVTDAVQSVEAAIAAFKDSQTTLDRVRNEHLRSVDVVLASQSIKATGGLDAAAQSYTLKDVSAALVSYFAAGGKAGDLATLAQNNYGIGAGTLGNAAQTIAGTAATGSAAANAATQAANAAAEAQLRTQAIRDYITSAMQTQSGADLAQSIYAKARSVGATQAEIAAAIGWSPSAVKDFFAGAGIPQFAVGTNYVPRDMTARIHEGEAIVPKAYNPAAGGVQSNETAAALRALADRLDRIEANTRATAGHTAGTDRKLARVIPGNALITEAST